MRSRMETKVRSYEGGVEEQRESKSERGHKMRNQMRKWTGTVGQVKNKVESQVGGQSQNQVGTHCRRLVLASSAG